MQGVAGSSFDAKTGVAQVLNREAHTFKVFYNTAMASTNAGASWFDTYRGDLVSDEKARWTVFRQWSVLRNGQTTHYQLRSKFSHSFFVADGSLDAGGVTMFYSDNAATWQEAQTFYSWPHVIASPVNTGGTAQRTGIPVATEPLLIPGSGPGGVAAYWMVMSYSLTAGGTGNPFSASACDLWRSLDGFTWDNVQNLRPTMGVLSVIRMFRSSGRVLLAAIGANAGFYTDSGPSLIDATWFTSVISGTVGPIQRVEPMFGGTWVTNRNGSGSIGGDILVSCNNGATFVATNQGGPGLNRSGVILKLGPSELLFFTADTLVANETRNHTYYSQAGGETMVDQGIWLVSIVGEQVQAAYLMSDSQPLIFSTYSAWTTSGRAQGAAQKRTICPVQPVTARLLESCGAPLTVDACGD